MVRLRLTGGTKAETTSRGEETGDQVDLIDLQGDSAQGGRHSLGPQKGHTHFGCRRFLLTAETKKYKIGDQTDGFAKVSIQSLHEENMKLIQLVSETKNANVVANTEILLKLLEDRTKCVENLVELEKIREASKAALVKEDDRDVKEKPGIQKRDVKRKRPAEKKLQKKDGREEAYSSRPALQPCGDEIVRAREEAYKKILPALVVIAGTQHLTSSVVTIPVNQYVHAKIAKEAGLHAGTWEGASVYNSVKLGLVPP